MSPADAFALLGGAALFGKVLGDLVGGAIVRRRFRTAPTVSTDEVNEGTTFVEFPTSFDTLDDAVDRCVTQRRKLVVKIDAGAEGDFAEVVTLVTLAARSRGADCRARLARPGHEFDVEFGFRHQAVPV
jgi:hypothetical protein